MILFRHLVGDVLRRHRLHQSRTLREVSAAARISLGYLSEVERGQKEASSELLASICEALQVPLSAVLHDAAEQLARFERAGGLLPPVEVEPERAAQPMGTDTGANGAEPVPARSGPAPGYVPIERVPTAYLPGGSAGAGRPAYAPSEALAGSSVATSGTSSTAVPRGLLGDTGLGVGVTGHCGFGGVGGVAPAVFHASGGGLAPMVAA